MMEPISSPLQGILGYTLVGEILGVTALSWTCIGMMLRKLRHESEEVPEPVMASLQTLKVEDSPEYMALMEKIRLLEDEKRNAPASESGPEEIEKLKKTIAYLENKLLEYEIVQEEISTLGELKAENEKLKVELNSLRAPVVPAETAELINKQFSEFSETKKESMPEDLQTLLTDIESLSKEKSTKP